MSPDIGTCPQMAGAGEIPSLGHAFIWKGIQGEQQCPKNNLGICISFLLLP